MTTESELLHQLVEAVRTNQKYKFITTDIVKQVGQEVLRKGIRGKAAVKAVRKKLHQIGGAYFQKQIDYAEAECQIESLPSDIHSAETKQFCRQIMGRHASTAERIPILDEFFQTCLASIAPINSVIDLASGLNAFAVPWMPLAESFTYTACDIYEDMLRLVGKFFNQYKIDGDTKPCNLINGVPEKHADVTFLLKTIPCLEQISKQFGAQILDLVQTQYILVSYPVHSLSGREKGMPNFYRQHFYHLKEGKNWDVQEFQFQSELAFLVRK